MKIKTELLEALKPGNLQPARCSCFRTNIELLAIVTRERAKLSAWHVQNTRAMQLATHSAKTVNP